MAETALDVHGLSYHLGKTHYNENGHEKSYNDINIGLGATHLFYKSLGMSAGFYQNSYRKNSNYLGFTLRHKDSWKNQNWHWVYGGKIIGVTGYKNTPQDTGYLRGVALLEAGIGYQNVSTLVAATYGVVFLSVSISIGN
jgi:hypothetical protein